MAVCTKVKAKAKEELNNPELPNMPEDTELRKLSKELIEINEKISDANTRNEEVRKRIAEIMRERGETTVNLSFGTIVLVHKEEQWKVKFEQN